MANKKITINTLMASIPETEKTEVKLEGEYFKDVTIQVKHSLPLEEAMSFVRDIVATCTDDEEAEFLPELFDFAVRMYVVMYYAGVDLSKDVKKAYRILYDTKLFELVYAHVNTSQSSNLILAAEKRIEHWKNILSSSVAGKVTEMMRKLEDLLEGSAAMTEAIDSADFKVAVERLAEAGILKPDGSPIPAQANDSIVESVAPNDVPKADAGSAGNIVYIEKKKKK